MISRTSRLTPAALLLATSTGLPVLASDWPQLLGPERDGVYAAEILVAWPTGGPRTLWERPIGRAFSAPVVSGTRLIVFDREGDRERLTCLDARSGKLLWSKDDAATYRDGFGFSDGPRATPTVRDGVVFTLGADAVLSARRLETGDRVWTVDARRALGARKGFFGAACSPLVEGKSVIVNVGGTESRGIVAFDVASGAVRWSATDHEASYSSPVAASLGADRHVFVFTREGLVDLEPDTGRVRFEFPWRARMNASVNAATPLVVDQRVFISASYRTGAALVHVADGKPKVVWSNRDALSCHYASVVHKDGHIYGYDGRQEHGPSLRAVELSTGKVVWQREGFGAGTVTLAGGRLLLVKESGELVLVDASPKGFRQIAAARVLGATVRAYPALAHGLLYVRNEKKLRCLDLRPEGERS